MILLDTRIWIWWINEPVKLELTTLHHLDTIYPSDVCVSAISCWEVAKLVEKGRLELPEELQDWFQKAIDYSGVTIIGLEPEIVMHACDLPGSFHNDPADQLIVATSRVRNIPLLTADGKILKYEHVMLYKK